MTWTEKTGFTNKQLFAIIMSIITLIGGLGLSYTNPGMVDKWFMTQTEMTREVIRAEIEDYIDQGLGGSPYQTEKSCNYLVNNLTVGATTYTYVLDGLSGKIMNGDMFSANKHNVLSWLMGNITAGTVVLKEVNWDITVPVTANVLVVEYLNSVESHYDTTGLIWVNDGGNVTMGEFLNGYNITDMQYQSYSYIIWRDGANYYAKNGVTGLVDYKGTNATIVIQNSIDALNSGVIYVKKGRYDITSLNMKSHVWIYGECISDQGTTYTLGTTFVTNGAVKAFNFDNVHYITLKDFRIESDGVSNDYGIYFNTSSYCIFDRLMIYGFNYDMFTATSTQFFDNLMQNCHLTGGRTRDFYGPTSYQFSFFKSKFGRFTTTSGNSFSFINCWVEDNDYTATENAMVVVQNRGFVITGCYFELELPGSLNGYLLNIGDQSMGGVVFGNEFKCNNIAGSYALLLGNLGAASSSYDMQYSPNSFTNCPNKILIQAGFKTPYGTGTILNGTTATTITHGLSYTPNIAEITITWSENPTNDPGNWWISGITSTQFTVNIRNDPGISNLDFSWRSSRNP